MSNLKEYFSSGEVSGYILVGVVKSSTSEPTVPTTPPSVVYVNHLPPATGTGCDCVATTYTPPATIDKGLLVHSEQCGYVVWGAMVVNGALAILMANFFDISELTGPEVFGTCLKGGGDLTASGVWFGSYASATPEVRKECIDVSNDMYYRTLSQTSRVRSDGTRYIYSTSILKGLDDTNKIEYADNLSYEFDSFAWECESAEFTITELPEQYHQLIRDHFSTFGLNSSSLQGTQLVDLLNNGEDIKFSSCIKAIPSAWPDVLPDPFPVPVDTDGSHMSFTPFKADISGIDLSNDSNRYVIAAKVKVGDYSCLIQTVVGLSTVKGFKYTFMNILREMFNGALEQAAYNPDSTVLTSFIDNVIGKLLLGSTTYGLSEETKETYSEDSLVQYINENVRGGVAGTFIEERSDIVITKPTEEERAQVYQATRTNPENSVFINYTDVFHQGDDIHIRATLTCK